MEVKPDSKMAGLNRISHWEHWKLTKADIDWDVDIKMRRLWGARKKYKGVKKNYEKRKSEWEAADNVARHLHEEMQSVENKVVKLKQLKEQWLALTPADLALLVEPDKVQAQIQDVLDHVEREWPQRITLWQEALTREQTLKMILSKIEQTLKNTYRFASALEEELELSDGYNYNH